MKKILVLFFIFYHVLLASSQNTSGQAIINDTIIRRPKLVVGIVIDQMRWDYLYRYYDRYAEDGGFKRLLSQGFSCENTMIPYTPSITACGHTCIYTGSVPAIHGITGNEWWDYSSGQMVYCTGDDSVVTTGDNSDEGKMSPHNLLVTTIGDELRLATNFRSKVIGIALKDRAAILPAGQSANGAYWYNDKTGGWITSSYYMNDLPKWLKDLNEKKLVDGYYAKNWNTLYPLNTYIQSAADEEPYEYRPFGATAKGFPYTLTQFAGKNYGLLHVTPYGNSFTLDMARAAITGEQLGAGTVTDMLTISLSSPDYIGHTFGPNSVEQEDDFLRLDKDLGDFLKFLDEKIGKNQYLLFLSADHGVANVPAFLKEHKIPTGNVDGQKLTKEINQLLKEKFNKENLVIGILNYQVYLDRKTIYETGLNKDSVDNIVLQYLLQQPGITRAFVLDALSNTTLPLSVKNAVANGYYPLRSGDIQLIYRPQWIDGFPIGGTTHGVWNPYDTHIPLLWFGWNVRPGKTNRTVNMTDIAPTIAAMLSVQMPSGSTGNVIEEVYKK
jgi:predicted AlkP superfamily pyrophosphatase or phosphodiesterase